MINNKKTRILFVCIGNSCRSQIAEGWGIFYNKQFFKNNFEIFSAGISPAMWIAENTKIVMKEKNIDISGQFSKGLDELKINSTDFLIALDPRVKEKQFNNKNFICWHLEDPIGKDLHVYREIRDILGNKILNFMKNF